MRLPCFAPALAEIPRARQHGHPDTSPQDRRLRIWPAMTAFPLTRSDALARLAQFTPRAGSAYGARRNFVSADGDHDDVSRLSAALRRRVIAEDEVVRTVLAAHPFERAEKFIAEVFWRTYWKGWLEARPGLWTQTLGEAALQQANPAIARAASAAIEGRTGIAAFDHWARELAETGYLHNWARMQVASIWTFTLGLPWQLGASWTYDRLIDADPASNTLSWRWVAGLHTAGKAYLADADRIAAMTGNQLHASGLASLASIPQDTPLFPRTPLRNPMTPDPARPTIVLITPEDCSLETELPAINIRAVATTQNIAFCGADRVAQSDALTRAAAHWQCPAIENADDLGTLARAHGCTQIITGFAPVGPVAAALSQLAPALGAQGIALAEHQREWDRLAWPYCTKGFFQLKTRIPDLLRQQGLA